MKRHEAEAKVLEAIMIEVQVETAEAVMEAVITILLDKETGIHPNMDKLIILSCQICCACHTCG